MAKAWSCVLLGAPGSGKGTQAKFINERWAFPHISTGDILRGEISKGSPLGKKVSEVLAGGNLVDDALMEELIRSRLSSADVSQGFLLDGYPRNLKQAAVLEKAVSDLKLPRLIAIAIVIPELQLKKRILGRLSCQQCGSIFHKELRPPKVVGVCDSCGAQLVQRKDDNEATVDNRLAVYRQETAPLIDFYKQKGFLSVIDGTKSIHEISSELEKILS